MAKMGVKGGMSMTTAFDVEFNFDKSLPNLSGGGTTPRATPPFVESFYSGDNKDVVTMLCDEAQLPNVQSATAQTTGRYLGEGPISYPHTRIYTDLSLGFLLDADLTALKFLTSWYDYIFGDSHTEAGVNYTNGIANATGTSPRSEKRTNRLAYMDEYSCTLKIIKTETNATASNGRAPITYLLENCYPYSIDAVPLSYGSSQITRVTANFYYTRHTVAYGN